MMARCESRRISIFSVFLSQASSPWILSTERSPGVRGGNPHRLGQRGEHAVEAGQPLAQLVGTPPDPNPQVAVQTAVIAGDDQHALRFTQPRGERRRADVVTVADERHRTGFGRQPGQPAFVCVEPVPDDAEVSGGQLTVDPHYRGSICGEQKCGEQANQGLLAIWTSSTANFGNFGTALSIFDLPYLFKNLDTANQISDTWLGEAQSKIAEETTQHKVFEVFASGGFRHLGNAARSVHVPSDLKGIKIRVTKSPIEYTLIKTWGAIPVPYDWLQLYQGLQTGVVSGQYVQVPWQYVYKMYEVQKYYTEIGGAWGGNHISMDLKQYRALSDDEKAWVRAGMDAFSHMARTLDNEWVKAEIQSLQQRVKIAR